MTDFTTLFTAAVNKTIAEQVAIAMTEYAVANNTKDQTITELTERINALEEMINDRRDIEAFVEREVKSQLEEYINSELDIDGAVDRALDGYDFDDAVADALGSTGTDRALTAFVNQFDFTSCENFDQAVATAVYNKMTS